MSRPEQSKEERLREYLAELEDGCHCFIFDQQLTVRSSNSLGDTPLHVAVRRGDLQIVGDMLDVGAEINAKGEDGFSALHNAVMFDNPDMVRLLLARGASVDTVNDWGEALIDTAVRRRNSAIVAAIKAHKA